MLNTKIQTKEKVLFADLRYLINGIVFQVQNELGWFCKEKQYSDNIGKLLKKIKFSTNVN